MPNARAIPGLVLLLSGIVAGSADAQIGSLIKKKATEVVKEAAKPAPKDSAKAAAKPVDSTKAAVTPTATPAPATTAGASPAPVRQDAKIWENYDFIPGSKVIFFTDFSDDRIGNFARRLKYVNGPVEVVERDGVKMLRSIGRSQFLIPVGKKLPERFTLEIDVMSPPVSGLYETLAFEGGAKLDRGDKSAEVGWHPSGTVIQGSGQNQANSPVKFTDAMRSQIMGKVAHVRVLMDSAYFKMYTNERRMYNIPELAFRRDSVIRVFVNGAEQTDLAVFITSIRVAESETDVLYDALATKGRWATQGILFATGKAEMQPESRPVLKEIASTMKEHADLKVLIEGHTDNVGTAASNLSLSDARAAAVKAVLIADFGIVADRITTKGMGDTKPSVPNTSAEGRAQNRRVEIVKQ
jgi:outer membrane protein OmpA-like peptidoglycan-associated protein